MQAENQHLLSHEAELSELKHSMSNVTLGADGKPVTDGGEGKEEADTAPAPMATNIPAPPPLPPIMDTDGALVPPPPPVPFGECVCVCLSVCLSVFEDKSEFHNYCASYKSHCNLN